MPTIAPNVVYFAQVDVSWITGIHHFCRYDFMLSSPLLYSSSSYLLLFLSSFLSTLLLFVLVLIRELHCSFYDIYPRCSVSIHATCSSTPLVRLSHARSSTHRSPSARIVERAIELAATPSVPVATRATHQVASAELPNRVPQPRRANCNYYISNKSSP